jgi:hypothetical protein
MNSAGGSTDLLDGSFLIRRSTVRRLLTAPRGLSQFCHVLHRLLVPRHPPNALTSLTTRTVALRAELAALRQMAKSHSLSTISPLSLGRMINIWTSTKKHDRSCQCRCIDTLVLHTSFYSSVIRFGPVGQARLELATPRLSSACSNQLSYWPGRPIAIGPSRPNSEKESSWD